ncbi:MAG: hypothetical protein ACREO9_03310 [Lysobacterales bacterium]
MFIRTACIFLALFSASLSAKTIEIAWTPDGRFGYEALLAADQADEICGSFTAGDAIQWTLKSSQALDFNIHYHQGDEVIYPVKKTAVTAGSERLAVTVPQTYCWMLTNTGGEAAVITLDLEHNPGD